ncbi:MAG: hypothetical protein AB2A00_30745 [Myxococcota bacterium]
MERPASPVTSAAPFDVVVKPPPKARSIVVPWVVAHLLVSALQHSLTEVPWRMVWSLLLVPAEWFILRTWIARAGWWIPANVLGGIVTATVWGLLVAADGAEGTSGGAGFMLTWSLVVTLAGTGEWLVLRQSTTRAAWWLVGLAVSNFALVPIRALLGEGLWTSGSTLVALGSGAITTVRALVGGMLLQWMFLPRHRPAGWKGPSVSPT